MDGAALIASPDPLPFSADFPRAAVEASAERILTSRHFARSRRLGAFLRFTLRQALDGRAHELKERTIGVEVYERALDYDPRNDPIVRSEAHRLRARLDAYYADEGAADPIVIAYPKGRYVPLVEPNPSDPSRGLGECRLVVAAFEQEGPADDAARAAEQALRARLAGRPGLRVLYRASALRAGRPACLEADFALEGSVARADGRCTLTVRVVRLADETEVANEVERFGWERLAEATRALAERAERAIGLAPIPHAAHATHAAARRRAGGRAVELFVKGRHSAIQYANSFDLRDAALAQRRLEAALALEPEFVDALAELGHLALLQLYPPRGEPEALREEARGHLERALALDARHPRSLYLLGHLEGSALRPREALGLSETAVALDPDDAEARTMLGVRYASLGFWEAAVAACDWGLALDPVWLGPHVVKAYCLTRLERTEEAHRALVEFAGSRTSPPELALARCDLAVAEGDLPGAEAALCAPESTLPLRPDLEQQAIARALAHALRGRHAEARPVLEARRDDPPRFRDDLIRLALALGEEALALERLARNPFNRHYRWLATQPLARPCLRKPAWRALLHELHEDWRRDLQEIGPRLPVRPPALPAPDALAPAPSRRLETRATPEPGMARREPHP